MAGLELRPDRRVIETFDQVRFACLFPVQRGTALGELGRSAVAVCKSLQVTEQATAESYCRGASLSIMPECSWNCRRRSARTIVGSSCRTCSRNRSFPRVGDRIPRWPTYAAWSRSRVTTTTTRRPAKPSMAVGFTPVTLRGSVVRRGRFPLRQRPDEGHDSHRRSERVLGRGGECTDGAPCGRRLSGHRLAGRKMG